MVRPATASTPAATRSRRWRGLSGRRSWSAAVGRHRTAQTFPGDRLVAGGSLDVRGESNERLRLIHASHSERLVHPAGRMRSTRARATHKSDVIVVGLGPSTGVSFSSSREPAGTRVDTPALCARAIRPDLPPTRMCLPSDETCLMFTVQSPWRGCRYSPRRSANDHRSPLGLSRVVVVGSRICRNRVTFAIPWPKRWRTW